jgi:hypothetical protein
MALADSPAANGAQEGSDDVGSVFTALADENYDFRTIDGIAESAGLSADRVREILDEHSDRVRLSAVPGPNREPLYTLAERPVKVREQLALVQSVVASPVG